MRRSALAFTLFLLLAAAWAALPAAPADEAEPGRPETPAGSPHGDLSAPCGDCHTTAGWTPLAAPLAFDHAATGFPLDASHRGPACSDCHQDLRFAWVGSSCADCHRDPHQGELGLGCTSCHDTRGWYEALVTLRERHAATLFPLTGAHAALDCAACHGGVPPREFSTTPTDCFACHAGDFRGAREPNHLAAGFPTTCETCHTTDEWRPADFRAHDDLFFPIFSGPHEGVWGACSDCHTAPASFAVFTCLSCHPRAETAEEHDDVEGYRYQTAACFACHPDGRE